MVEYLKLTFITILACFLVIGLTYMVITSYRQYAVIVQNQQSIIAHVDAFIGPVKKVLDQNEQSRKRDEKTSEDIAELNRKVQESVKLWQQHVDSTKK